MSLFTFPTPQRTATTEAELRACKMGFRAPNLLARRTRRLPMGNLTWKKSNRLDYAEARAELMKPRCGVGGKLPTSAFCYYWI